MSTSRFVAMATVASAVYLFPALAHAQATRTWVSGVGDDANPCSRTAPCKTFAGAISKTAPRGEIDTLDPGGFGAVTITKSITIEGFSGLGGVLVASGSAITVNASSSDVVILRNLDINGLIEVGRKVRDLFAEGSPCEERIRALADDAYLETLAQAMVGALGGKVGLAPRLYLKKLVGDILDRIEQFQRETITIRLKKIMRAPGQTINHFRASHFLRTTPGIEITVALEGEAVLFDAHVTHPHAIDQFVNR